MSQAERMAATAPRTVSGTSAADDKSTVQLRTVSSQTLMYHSRTPNAMKDSSDTVIRLTKDGAVQISNGRIGSLAPFFSQNTKAAKWTTETMSKAYS